MSAWPQARLGELIVEAAYGTSVKCSDTAEGMPVLRMGNVRYDGTLDLGDLKYASLTDAEQAKFGIEEGDILFNRTNSKELVGKTGIWDGRFPAAAASYFIRVRVARDVVCPKWVWRFMNSTAMKDRLLATARGAIGQANINSLELKSFLLPLPPLEEQQRIVGLLDRAAEIRRRADAARARARAIVPALFLDMFGDPATNPKGWTMATVGEVLDSASYGTSQKASDTGDGLPVIRMGNVTMDGQLATADLKYIEPTVAEREKAELLKGDLLFNRTNSKELVGKTGLWDGRFDAVAASYFIRLRVNRARIVPTYLWAFFNTSHMKRVLFQTARGAIGQANINARELRAFPVAAPPLPLQTAFAEQAQRLEATARALDTAATKAGFMAAALSAEMFRGAPMKGGGNGA